MWVAEKKKKKKSTDKSIGFSARIQSCIPYPMLGLPCSPYATSNSPEQRTGGSMQKQNRLLADTWWTLCVEQKYSRALKKMTQFIPSMYVSFPS